MKIVFVWKNKIIVISEESTVILFFQFTVGDHSDHRCSSALTELNISNLSTVSNCFYLDKMNQPKSNYLNVAAGNKILGLKFCVMQTAKFPSCHFYLNFCKPSLWSSCCLIHVSNDSSKFFFLFPSFTAPFPVEQCHDQPILSFSCIIQCTVRWVSGRIKSEQTTAWNKCWCTVPNTAQSVLIISWLLGLLI